ncbi:PREDICTED: 2-oxoglutarate and iron-dependent oxygenase domain-containing protein 3-like [Ceratosolen solmsi marchali]|uniref:2-oxoglutarate and iron-dependent oxygenase domain-containing protein 3-like n=1 Tax=Ceratosolen solmsi marchali TaxID=326594 RepID=A0AAJ7DWH9_9HYME|nr:PREDICTED: 2-oxoglutarate and iron-dependent oxygenase domain-containing protein 3-like [Ceratosolen solmsi marchali]
MAPETIRKRRNDVHKEQEAVDEKKVESEDAKVVKPKYGPYVTFPYQRVWSRCILILGVMLIVWYNSKNSKEVVLARQKDILVSRALNVECSDDYKSELDKFSGCLPEKCGRVVTDKLVSASEADMLLRFAKSGLKLGEVDGGVKILDLQSGALSKGDKFINVYSLKEAQKLFNSADFAIYKVVKTKIQHAIAHHFGVNANKIYLTKPTFFSQITNIPAKTIHDEYWQPHVDKETYKSFHYTSLLYLSDYGRDFEGGRFIYIDKNGVNTTVEPRKGRISMFTSGSENLHAVEKVTLGTRYALTVSFTCDKDYATSDPNFDKIKDI